MQPEATSESVPPTAPNWATLDRDVLCPLCDYNLRGLVEPRCPECGHLFNWPDLLDRDRWEHRWLFEHRRKRLVRSFLQTFLTSLVPGMLWKSIWPIHKPIPRRLYLYWMIIAVLVGFVVIGMLTAPYVRMYRAVQFQRQWVLRQYNRMPNDPYVAAQIRQFGSAQKAVEARFPLPRLGMLFSSNSAFEDVYQIILPIAIMYVSWPWLTVLVLMIFRSTMRMARIRPEHVIRCAVYSFDGGIVLFAVLFAMLAFHPLGNSPRVWREILPLLDPNYVLVMAFAMTLLTIRLCLAYRMYLRFPHAILTCVLSQVVVAMTMLLAYMTLAM